MTSSNGNSFRVTDPLCAENSPATSEWHKKLHCHGLGWISKIICWEICYGQKRFEFKMGFRRISHATKASIAIFFNELEIRKIGRSYSLDSVASFIARLMIGSVHQHGTPVPLTQLNRFSRWRIQLNIYQIAILVQSLKLQWTSSL